MKIAHIPYVAYIVLLVISLIFSSIDRYYHFDYHFDPDRQQSIHKIDVNTVGIEQLQNIPGVSASVAENIVEYRTDHGDFQRMEDLLDVPGVGPVTLAAIMDYGSVGE